MHLCTPPTHSQAHVSGCTLNSGFQCLCSNYCWAHQITIRTQASCETPLEEGSFHPVQNFGSQNFGIPKRNPGRFVLGDFSTHLNRTNNAAAFGNFLLVPRIAILEFSTVRLCHWGPISSRCPGVCGHPRGSRAGPQEGLL